jgi:hypothetical protein
MRIIQLFLILSTSLISIAQIGGSSAFAFALIENNARHTDKPYLSNNDDKLINLLISTP